MDSCNKRDLPIRSGHSLVSGAEEQQGLILTRPTGFCCWGLKGGLAASASWMTEDILNCGFERPLRKYEVRKCLKEAVDRADMQGLVWI